MQLRCYCGSVKDLLRNERRLVAVLMTLADCEKVRQGLNASLSFVRIVEPVGLQTSIPALAGPKRSPP